jgi:hypothetical protein
MNLQSTLVTEQYITHITGILNNSAMHYLMLLQMGPLPEGLITHITRIWTQPTVNALMYLQSAVFTE